MDDELLIVEDLMLLLLADDGSQIAGSKVLHCALPAAILTELALTGRLEVHSHRRVGGTRIHASRTNADPEIDPLLAEVLRAMGGSEHSAYGLVSALGLDVRQPVLDRLAARGLILRETRKILGVLPTTRWPSLDSRAEAALRDRVTAVLDRGRSPDARTAAIIALISAAGVYVQLSPRMPWNAEVAGRLKAIERGEVTGHDSTPATQEIIDEIARAVFALTSSASSAPIL
ncbi:MULTISPECIES: GOLPH3/VPS74 family protein [Brevibacterium]|uniref:Golgi phosphoprotein 3 (GPP34) n=1 Tax=Brevibacterium metallidurans TaxID=1482676 RepID=A0ABN0SJ31_9MICO